MDINLEKKGLTKNEYLKFQNPPYVKWTDLKGAELETAWDEFLSTEPVRLLREQRDGLISLSDWWASSDLTMSAEQKDYRKALRDLPSTASPELDEDGQLTNVIWPTKPE